MFKLVTDNTADLPLEYLKEHKVDYMVLSYILDGVAYGKEKYRENIYPFNQNYSKKTIVSQNKL